MVTSIGIYVANIIGNLFDIFFQLLEAVGGTGLWMGSILLTLVFKFLLGPIFGVASSDMAKKSYNAFKRRKDK